MPGKTPPTTIAFSVPGIWLAMASSALLPAETTNVTPDAMPKAIKFPAASWVVIGWSSKVTTGMTITFPGFGSWVVGVIKFATAFAIAVKILPGFSKVSVG